MRKRRPKQLALELPSAPPKVEPQAGMWGSVDALPAKAARYHRERLKTLKPKLKQVDMLGSIEPLPAKPVQMRLVDLGDGAQE